MKINQWKPVHGYEGLYEVNEAAQVRSICKGSFHRQISTRIDRAGYTTVKLVKKGKSCTVYVHRILALAFINNPENKPAVNHINGIKTDNAISNLEWVTYSENMKHAYQNGLSKVPYTSNKKVIDKCNQKTYISIREASEHLGVSYNSLSKMLNGKRENKTCLQLAA